MLTLCTVASGSKGNCTLIQSPRGNILIDLGISCKKSIEKLGEAGVSPEQIDAIVVTHAHTDHVGGIDLFANKFGTPVYAPYAVCDGMLRAHGNKSYRTLQKIDHSDFFVKDMTVSGFAVPHDVPCYGYSIYAAGSKVTIVTDIGVMSDAIVREISDSDVVVLESNHDIDMLKANGRYSASLKQRILGPRGHLSNPDSAEISAKLVQGGVRQIILAHLSEENNDPLVALRAHEARLLADGVVVGRDVLIDVAMQHAVSKQYEIL